MFDVSKLFIQCTANNCCEHVYASVYGSMLVLCLGKLVMLGGISSQSTTCPLREKISELDTVMYNPHSKIFLMARCTEILAKLGP